MALHFNRTVSAELLAELRPGGRFDSLVRYRDELPRFADVQLRRAQGPVCHASLYIGLTSVLNVEERGGMFALSAHKTHRQEGGFDPAWCAFRPAEDLGRDWPAVEGYLDRLLDGRIDPRWYRREGAVHALLCSGGTESYGAVQREAAPWADSPPSVTEIVGTISDMIWAAAQATGRTDAWWPGIRDRGVRKAMGDELDVLAVDGRGRLLCVEAKPADETAGIVWSVAQVLVYAELFARWVDQDSAAAAATLALMAEQRGFLGLLQPSWAQRFDPAMRVAPVVAIGPGRRSPVALERLGDLADALGPVPRHQLVDPVEVWLLGPAGEPTEVWRPHEGPPPPGRGDAVAPPALLGAMMAAGTERVMGLPPDDPGDEVLVELPPTPPTFVRAARKAAEQWKAATDLLPPQAKAAAPYGSASKPLPYVLPVEYQWLNLLPEAREIARSRFEAAAIHWHGDDDGPNPNLLSSQVQCLNALAPLVDRPSDLSRWLAPALPVAQVIPFGAETSSPFDASDHVVFEWQGLVDHLGEWRDNPPIRGTMATSIDAALRYRTPGGSVEMALIEWKYTESYPYGGRLDGAALRHQHRLDRYGRLAFDEQSPVRLDLGVDYEDLFAEPTYQLLRQQLLAWRLEATHELDVSRAVVVYAAPAGNRALLEESLGTHRFRAFAEHRGGLTGGWRALLRRPDRFVSVDTSQLAMPHSICNGDFRQRYSHLLGDARPLTRPVPAL